MRERIGGGWAAAALLLSAVLAVALLRYLADQRGDDSFIFYRIATNLAAGWGPVYNAGEHVEAYSSPTWLFLLTLGHSLGIDFVAFSRGTGALFAALTLFATHRLARLLGATPDLAAGAVLATCLGGSLWYWAPAGLETPLYVALFGWACASLARGAGRGWAVATALLGVTRPEGPGLVLVSIACAWMVEQRRPSGRLLALALAPSVTYLVFRLFYFGVPLPNTYYAKATGALGKRLVDGFDYALWVIVPLAISAVHLSNQWRRGRFGEIDRKAAGVLILTSALVAVVVLGGGDWMWGRRLILPCVPPTIALVVHVAGSIRARALRTAFTVACALVIQNDDLPFPDRKDYEPYFGFAAAKTIVSHPDRAMELRFIRPLRTILSASLGRRLPDGARIEGTMTTVSHDVATYIRERWPESLVAVNHAGALPYYTAYPTLDMTGLADAYIARKTQGGLHEKYDPEYVLSRRPRLVVLNTRERPTPELWYVPGYWEGETALVRTQEFNAMYRPVPVYWPWQYADGYTSYILLYERVE